MACRYYRCMRLQEDYIIQRVCQGPTVLTGTYIITCPFCLIALMYFLQDFRLLGVNSKWEYFPRIHSYRHCNLSGQPNLQSLAHSSLALIPFTKLCVVVLFLKWPVNSLPRVAKDPERRQATRDRPHKSSRRCDLWIFHLTEIIAIFHVVSFGKSDEQSITIYCNGNTGILYKPPVLYRLAR